MDAGASKLDDYEYRDCLTIDAARTISMPELRPDWLKWATILHGRRWWEADLRRLPDDVLNREDFLLFGPPFADEGTLKNWMTFSEDEVFDILGAALDSGALPFFGHDAANYPRRIPSSAGKRIGGYLVVDKQAFAINLWADDFQIWLDQVKAPPTFDNENNGSRQITPIHVSTPPRRARYSATREATKAVLFELYTNTEVLSFAKQLVAGAVPVGPGISTLARQARDPIDARVPRFQRPNHESYEERIRSALMEIAADHGLS